MRSKVQRVQASDPASNTPMAPPPEAYDCGASVTVLATKAESTKLASAPWSSATAPPNCCAVHEAKVEASADTVPDAAIAAPEWAEKPVMDVLVRERDAPKSTTMAEAGVVEVVSSDISRSMRCAGEATRKIALPWLPQRMMPPANVMSRVMVWWASTGQGLG